MHNDNKNKQPSILLPSRSNTDICCIADAFNLAGASRAFLMIMEKQSPKRIRVSTPQSREKARIAAREKYASDPEKYKKMDKEYREKNRANILENRRAWHAKNRDKLIIAKRLRYAEKRESILIAAKKYREENPQKRKDAWDKWYLKNKDKRKNDWAEWYNKNAIKISNSSKFKRSTDAEFSLKERIRATTTAAFRGKGFKKDSKTALLLGCSWSHLKSHIEKQFTKGMNWKNRNQWHIDHIIPLSSAKNESELCTLSHFSNLRPLWKCENLSKGNKIITCQPELCLTLL